MGNVTISKGNSKLGNIPNISLPPGISCEIAAKCFGGGCYAMKAYRMYPNVRQAWDGNWDLLLEDPEEYFRQIRAWLTWSGSKRFRWHVGGDIPNQHYLNEMKCVATYFPEVEFLAFTKRYRFDFSDCPTNLNIILSAWPGMDLPEDTQGLGVAYLEEDSRWDRGGYYLRCPGNCQDCGHLCWKTVCEQVPVVFPRH